MKKLGLTAAELKKLGAGARLYQLETLAKLAAKRRLPIVGNSRVYSRNVSTGELFPVEGKWSYPTAIAVQGVTPARVTIEPSFTEQQSQQIMREIDAVERSRLPTFVSVSLSDVVVSVKIEGEGEGVSPRKPGPKREKQFAARARVAKREATKRPKRVSAELRKYLSDNALKGGWVRPWVPPEPQRLSPTEIDEINNYLSWSAARAVTEKTDEESRPIVIVAPHAGRRKLKFK